MIPGSVQTKETLWPDLIKTVRKNSLSKKNKTRKKKK